MSKKTDKTEETNVEPGFGPGTGGNERRGADEVPVATPPKEGKKEDEK